jgi:hypothetical protein
MGYSRAVNVAGDTDALIHASRIFGREFNNVLELIDFVSGSGDPNQIVASMADPNRLIFDGEWSEPLQRAALELGRFAAFTCRSDVPAPEGQIRVFFLDRDFAALIGAFVDRRAHPPGGSFQSVGKPQGQPSR